MAKKDMSRNKVLIEKHKKDKSAAGCQKVLRIWIPECLSEIS